MKAVLALATLTLVSLIFEEKARQIAGEVQDGYSHLADQARDATETLTGNIERAPLISLLIAGIAGYVASGLVPRHK